MNSQSPIVKALRILALALVTIVAFPIAVLGRLLKISK